MTCRHGTDEPDPPEPFASDDELRIYLGLPNTIRGFDIVSAMSPYERAIYAGMRSAERQLRRGEIPRGAIACDRVGQRRR